MNRTQASTTARRYSWQLFLLPILFLLSVSIIYAYAPTDYTSRYRLENNYSDSTFKVNLAGGGSGNTFFNTAGNYMEGNYSLYLGGAGYANQTGHSLKSGNNDTTFCFWMRPNGTLTATVQYVLAVGCSSSYSTGCMSILGFNNVSYKFFGLSNDKDFTTVPASNVWSHVCLLYNSSNKNIILYINGSLSNTQLLSAYQDLRSNSSGTAVTVIGASTDRTGSRYTGFVDDVQLYDRLLSSSEINQVYLMNYSSGTGPDYSPVLISRSIADITITNVIGNPLILVYNFSQPALTASSPYINLSFINARTVINGTVYTNFNHSYKNNTGINYTFSLDDNDVYPGIYNLPETTMENTPHITVNISNSNIFYKTTLLGLNASKTNSFLEAALSTNGNARIYYCNSSYSTGGIAINPNCVLFGSTTSNTFNHTANNSQHNIFSMPIIGGTLGGVVVTTNSSFSVTSFTGTASLQYINNTTRVDAVQMTNNNGNTWTNQAWTTDLHVHQYDATDGLSWTACGSNSTATLCSAQINDTYDLTPLNPTAVTVTINNSTLYYNDTLLITRTNSSSFYGYIASYSYYIYDASLNLYRTINTTTNATSQTYTISNMTPGLYYAAVKATDNFSLSSYSFSETFHVGSRYISPCNTTVTLNSSGVSQLFLWTTDSLSGITQLIGVNASNSTIIFANTTGTTTLTNNTSGLYNLYLSQDYIQQLDCSFTTCINRWSRTLQPCGNDSLRLITYTDSSSCPSAYDVPANNGTYEACTNNVSSTFNTFFLVILIGLLLVAGGLYFKNYILLIIGGLTLFLSGTYMLLEPVSNLTSGVNLIIGVILWGLGAYIFATAAYEMIENGRTEDEED